MNGDKEIQPKAPVEVSITFDDAIQASSDATFQAVHIADGAADVIPVSTDAAVADGSMHVESVEFSASGFSVYGITYTVDFHYNVDGKEYSYSIPGGGFITLSDLVNIFGINNGEFVDDTDGFIAEIEKVRFSSPKLASIAKVEKDTTVHALKKSLGLECEYSSSLTSDDIAQMDSARLNAGDWVLISLKSFTSEEELTVTMKNGDVFTIKVTDSQMALNIHSNIVDTYGNHIHLQDSVANSFTVYQKQGTETSPIDGQDVKDLNVDSYSDPADYNGYSEFGTGTEVHVGTNGTGMVYVYGVTPAMYYVQEDKSTVPDTITDSDGHTWKYVGTRIETEYVWRDGANDGKLHHSDTYTKSSDAYNSIPEVVGTYKNYDGDKWTWTNDQGEEEELLNTFLDFYAYNIYKPQSGNLKINKTVTVNGTATETTLADGTYTFELWNADGTEQITHKADGTEIGDLAITVTGGQTGSLTIEGLNGATYIVRETGTTNTATMEMTSNEEGYDAAMRGIVVTVSENSDAAVTFINDYSTVTRTVKKIWNGSDIPSNLSVTLYENEVATDNTVTLSAGNSWTATINNLPKYRDGKEIHYTWVEGSVPTGFFITGYDVVETDNHTTTTITNTHRTYEFTTFYEGTKEWFDDNDAMGVRPEALHVTLYASYVTNPGSENPVYGEPEATFFEPVWTKVGNKWTFRFENIPVFDENGEVIIYTSSETAPGGYEKTENVTPTEYSLGTFVLESGNQRVTPNSTKTFNIESLLDLPVFGIKKGGTYIIWSPRTPTPREESQARQALAQRDSHFANARWYIDSQVIPTDSPNNTVYVTFDPEAENPYVALRFNASSAWSWFVYGKFNGGENKYQKGTAEFTNTLTHVTPELTGTKIWDIAGDTVPADPILRLTRTVTITPEEGESYTTAPETVDATPTWTGEGKTRTFTYHDLPKYDLDGNEYIYHVAETSFVVNDVIYTTVRHSDDTYTVTSNDESAPTFVTIQVDEPIEGSKQLKSTITNAESTDFSFSKIWYNTDKEIDIWPEGKTITVTLNAFTEDDEKALEDVEVTLSPFDPPAGWDVTVNGSGTRTTFTTSGLPTTKDGKPLTYYVVEKQVDGYLPPAYQNADGTPIEGGDKALNGQQVVNSIPPKTVTVKKVWVDDENKYELRPNSIQVQLKEDGTEYGEPVTLPIEGETNEEKKWTYTWSDLKKDATYTVTELNVPEGTYSSQIEKTVIDDFTDEFTITNTLQKATLTVTKKLTGSVEYITIPEDGFHITVTFDHPGVGTPAITGEGSSATAAADDKGYDLYLKVTEDGGTASATFTVPVGIKYSVAEDSNIDSRFEVSYSLNGDTVTEVSDETISENAEVTVTNKAPTITKTGVDLDTTAGRTALLSVFAFAMMCILGYSLRRRYTFRSRK